MTTPYTMSADATTFVKAANKAAMRTALGTPMQLDTANQNLAIGHTAGLAGGTSSNVISIGDGTLSATMTFLGDSVFCGTNSGRLVTDGNGNVAVGNLTLATITTCTHNVAIGDACCRL